MNINIRTNRNFATQLNKLDQEYGEEFRNLQGLDEDKLSFTDFIDNFIDIDTVADASVDASSNIAQKDVVVLSSEMSKPHQKLLAFHKLYYEIHKMYGFKVANEAFEKMWNYAIYLHDFNTATFISYCFAYDIKDIVEKGLFFIDNYNAKPPRHLDSFVQILMEGICFLARRQSGAVGLPNLIPYLYYFWSRDVANGYYTKDPETYKRQQIQALIYRLNQPWVRSDQSAFTNVSVFDHPYFEAIFGGSQFPDGAFMIDEEEEIIQFQKDFIDVVNEIREENVFTFPVLTSSLLYQNKFVDEEFAKWSCEASRKWNLFNFFTDSTVNSLSNCCRLKSDVTDLYFNSIGGTALKVGSVKVSTLNIARLAYEHRDNEIEFLKALKDLTELNLKILDAQRHIIMRNVEKGLLPNFSSGLIDFEHLYSTVGVNGIYETIKTFGYTYVDEIGNTHYTDDAYALGKDIFETIRGCIDEFVKDKDYKINIEQIPGEQAAVKLQKADTLLYPRRVVKDLPLYGNQWIPLGIKASIAERTKICAAFDSYCNGGSIEHINIDTYFDTFDKAWHMLNWVAQQGVTYFAFNGKVSQCKNHHSFYGDVCPECGEPVQTEYTRTVGFYTPTNTWSKERKAEYKMREWMPLNEKAEYA
jgi:ribonucleoside-triphosphate reductase